MRVDVALAAAAAGAAHEMQSAVEQVSRRGPTTAQVGTRDVPDVGAHQRGQICGAPLAIYVGLRDPELSPEDRAAVEGVIPDLEVHILARSRRSEKAQAYDAEVSGAELGRG